MKIRLYAETNIPIGEGLAESPLGVSSEAISGIQGCSDTKAHTPGNAV